MTEPARGDEVPASSGTSGPASDNTLTGILLLIPLGIGTWLLYWGLTSFGGPPSCGGWLGCMFDFRLSFPWAISVSALGALLLFASIRSLLRL